MANYYEIFIFTASTSTYAKPIIKLLDPGEEFILGLLTRENCMGTKNGFFIKDLRIVESNNSR